jgi:phosphoglycerate kinase
LKALGQSVGRSYVDTHSVDLCKEILAKAAQLQVPFYYPHDYIVAQHDFEGPLDLIDTQKIDSDQVGVSIGPKTVQQWAPVINQAKSILVNGLMGSLERLETLTFIQELFTNIALSEATSIIAGGDSIAAAYGFKVANQVSYLSTGGGVTLQYISGQPLPGLIALKDRTKTQ